MYIEAREYVEAFIYSLVCKNQCFSNKLQHLLRLLQLGTLLKIRFLQRYLNFYISLQFRIKSNESWLQS